VLRFEGIAIAYFAALACAAPFLKPRDLNSWRAALSSAAAALATLAIAEMAPFTARLWLGHAYLVAGYWIPALLVSGVSPGAFEAWLVRTDVWWRRWSVPLPRAAVVLFELSYLLCYVMVPGAFVLVLRSGTQGEVDRFWTAVLAAGFACYGTLPWLVARPPRMLHRGPQGSAPQTTSKGAASAPHPTSTHAARTLAVRGINVFVLGRVSHGHNTFPSGHVAVSIAAALGVLAVSPAAGEVMLAIAAGIAIGATAGRYHYAIDVLLGIAIGAAAAVIA
jgi:hypothetical protein